jgi:hypothetical protein
MKKQRFNYWYTNYRAYWTLRSVWMDFCEWFSKHCPVHIPTRRPKPLGNCYECKKSRNRLCAYDTGDGWFFFWECENGCGTDEEGIVGWYPFWFGAWANTFQLEQVGTEVV